MTDKSTIYTKKGDTGTTQLGDGTRVNKGSDLLAACGAIDELNSFLGLASATTDQYQKLTTLKQQLQRMQNDLVKINAVVTKAADADSLSDNTITLLEHEIDDMSSSLPTLNEFILPGGKQISAQLHLARAVCRRAERRVAALAHTNKQLTKIVLPFLNRLSDWLFVAARFTEENL